MTVQPFTRFSDNKPLLLTLNFYPSVARTITSKLHETYAPAPICYKINADSHAILKSAMTDPEVEIAAKLILDDDYPLITPRHTQN